MTFWSELRLPTERDLLIGFYDLTGFGRYSETTEAARVLETMTGYFALTGDIITKAGGRLIKTMGDAGLVAFPADLADAGVAALQTVRTKGDTWLATQGYRCRAIVKLHLGPVALGRVGSPGDEILDVYGKTVSVAAAVASTGLAMTPAVFRRLSAETRKAFKKHTPPITYIDAEDMRPRQR